LDAKKVRKEILETIQPATLAALRWILEVLPAAEIACGVRASPTVAVYFGAENGAATALYS
jgi:hypothetical protein